MKNWVVWEKGMGQKKAAGPRGRKEKKRRKKRGVGGEEIWPEKL
jgi:hypothetical protein